MHDKYIRIDDFKKNRYNLFKYLKLWGRKGEYYVKKNYIGQNSF